MLICCFTKNSIRSNPNHKNKHIKVCPKKIMSLIHKRRKRTVVIRQSKKSKRLKFQKYKKWSRKANHCFKLLSLSQFGIAKSSRVNKCSRKWTSRRRRSRGCRFQIV